MLQRPYLCALLLVNGFNPHARTAQNELIIPVRAVPTDSVLALYSAGFNEHLSKWIAGMTFPMGACNRREALKRLPRELAEMLSVAKLP